ncbi:TPA: hypothetical protein QHC20_004899 [Raoultella ornithinolytica]|nr:hypothetical protein [Raoultella ornithinolytica]HDT5897652.1 hypothetical protein [Raoultella ornithinolytica]HDT5911727.1 hypothetical protein [Raoultella ornithinolytica]HDT5913738.1 hypothetical protein [Raoultella ornithinolytica]HDT5967506.1 hypothetical protein [Raoultella ornithinolytica]
MSIETVNELIQSLESAGELSIKERKYLKLAKAYADKEAENVALALTFEKCREVSGCPEGVDLQDYLRQLVSELSVVEEIHNDAVFITDELYDASPKEVQNIIRSLACMKMPAYARLVAGIKADGVEEFSKTLEGAADICGKSKAWEAQENLLYFAARGLVFAKKLREGADK